MLQRAGARVTYVDATASVCGHSFRGRNLVKKGLRSSDEGRGDHAQA
jgi:hypothetical protein